MFITSPSTAAATIAVVVVDPDGTILWQGLGGYRATLAAELEQAVTTARPSTDDM